MKKILMILMIPLSLLLVGCTSLNNDPISRVEELLNSYQILDETIVNELNESLVNTTYTDEQKEEYKEIMKEQYKSLTYDIKEDRINGNTATVTVAITVKDYYKALKEANLYLVNHMDEFLEDGNYANKFNDYKLEKLKEVKEKVTYTVDFNLTKINNKWTINDLDKDTLDKISGIYAY